MTVPRFIARRTRTEIESLPARLPGGVGGIIGLLLAALGICGCLLIWFDRGKDEYEQHQAQARVESAERKRRVEYRLAGQGLAFELETGVVGPGHPLADLTARFHPNRIDQYGEFDRVLYRDGDRLWIDLWARDGRVVEAWRMREATGATAAQDRRFADKFFEMSAADRAVRTAAMTAVSAVHRVAGMAAAGPAGYIAVYEPPPPERE